MGHRSDSIAILRDMGATKRLTPKQFSPTPLETSRAHHLCGYQGQENIDQGFEKLLKERPSTQCRHKDLILICPVSRKSAWNIFGANIWNWSGMPTVLGVNFWGEFFGGGVREIRLQNSRGNFADGFAENFAGNFPKIGQTKVKKKKTQHKSALQSLRTNIISQFLATSVLKRCCCTPASAP